MPRARYTINEADYNHAVFYLSGRLRNYDIEFGEHVARSDAENEYLRATGETQPEKQATRLNAWCEKYLRDVEWQKLKAAIRKRRERFQRYGDQKSLTISARSHELLAQLAERDGVTFSEVLEHYLAKALNSGRGRVGVARRRKPK